MKKVISSILFALLIGAAAAFFRPAMPYQVEVVTKPALFPRGGSMDFGLDNPDIAEDQNITPARKCGFCMGVSQLTMSILSFFVLCFQILHILLVFFLDHNSDPDKPTVQVS
jgi:hypothetical protein